MAEPNKVQQTATKEQVKVVTNAREVGEQATIGGPATGSGEAPAPSDGVVLEGLGNISEDRGPSKEDDTTLGAGEYVVVLHDLVSGVSATYHKGDVRRVSNFIPHYGDEKHIDVSRATAKRLFDGKAIRLATKEEQGQGHIELGIETDELSRERTKRIELERQIDELKKAQSLDKDIKGPEAANWQ